jgi:GT2 family glycosyltransferase
MLRPGVLVYRALVSLLHYNAPGDIIEAVRSLGPQMPEGSRLQVLDNGSRPEAVEEIRRALPDVVLRQTGGNLGYTGGNNAAIEQALAEGYDAVILCNQDIEVDPGGIAALVEIAAAHPDAGLLGGVETCYFTGAVRAAGARGYSFWRSRFAWDTVGAPGGANREVDYVQGALVMLTRAAMERGIRFDDQIFLYYDEIDLGLEIRRAGLKAYVDGRVIVRHKNKENYLNPKAAYYHQRNRVYIVRKHGAWYHQAVFQAYALVLELPAKAVWRSLHGHGRFARACLAGHVDGAWGRMGAGRASRL